MLSVGSLHVLISKVCSSVFSGPHFRPPPQLTSHSHCFVLHLRVFELFDPTHKIVHCVFSFGIWLISLIITSSRLFYIVPNRKISFILRLNCVRACVHAIVYLAIYWWTLRLSPHLDYCRQCYGDREKAHFFLRRSFHFSWGCLQHKDGRVVQQCNF